MRVVVTGATGNVGSQLVPQLLDHPDVSSVVGIARRLSPSRDQRVEWHALDVAEHDLRPVLAGADAVVHLAWLLQPSHDPAQMRRVNVDGTRRVIDALVAAGVPALVHASSVGAYSPGPKAPRADESHPAQGIGSSPYSRHKARVEAMLDQLEAEHPERRVVRLRPAIVLQPAAASALARYFLGPFLPQSLVRPSLLPVVPDVPGLAIQAVHAEDMARAYVLACTSPVVGAFNIAAEPVLDPSTLAALLGARTVPVPAALLRGLVESTWRLHVHPTDPGWVDIALRTPLLDTTRARTVLGWTPAHDAGEALLATLRAMGTRQGADTPVLRPRTGLPRRALEVVRGLGPGSR